MPGEHRKGQRKCVCSAELEEWGSCKLCCVTRFAIDSIDRQIIHALTLEPRVPFRALGDVVGISDQTAARRYRRLRESIGLRILARVNGERVGWVDWFIRLRCTPGSADAIATALSRRDDTRWVQLASGGTEIVGVVQARSPEQRDTLFLEGIPKSRRVISVSAHLLLRTFTTSTWPVLTEALSETQMARLGDRFTGRQEDDSLIRFDASDELLLAHLAHDGRASTAGLATATNWHESSVRRRIADLRRAAVLYFDIDLDQRAFGLTSNSLLWISVRPDYLDRIGHTLATHPEAPFVAAVTGTSNLLANVVCRDGRHLYAYVSQTLGQLPGIRNIETVPLIRTIKRAGSSDRPHDT
jgi:DNA-binding Lrp family transcriptional regulator